MRPYKVKTSNSTSVAFYGELLFFSNRIWVGHNGYIIELFILNKTVEWRWPEHRGFSLKQGQNDSIYCSHVPIIFIPSCPVASTNIIVHVHVYVFKFSFYLVTLLSRHNQTIDQFT